MTVLIVIASVLLIFAIILLMPVSVSIKYEDDYFMKIRIAGIKVYEIEPKKDIKNPESPDTESDTEAEKQGQKFFEKLKKKLGFFGAIKEIIYFAKTILEKLGKKLLSHITFKKLTLDITVSDENAMTTALEYGAVCSAVYPILSFLTSATKLHMKEINIVSDFNNGKQDFKFSCKSVTNVIFLLSTVVVIFKEYNKFKIRNEI